jgi:hypothetical protein
MNGWSCSCLDKGRVMAFPWISRSSDMNGIGRWSPRNDSTIDRYWKCLISMMSSANGMHNPLDALKGNTYHGLLFSQSIVPDLIRNISKYQRRKTSKGHRTRMDTSPSYNYRTSIERLAATRARRVPHLAHRLGFTSSNFFSLGCLKENGPAHLRRLRGNWFPLSEGIMLPSQKTNSLPSI